MASALLLTDRERVRLAKIRADLKNGSNPYEDISKLPVKDGIVRDKVVAPTLRVIPLSVRIQQWKDKVITPKRGRIVRKFRSLNVVNSPEVINCLGCDGHISVATSTLVRVLESVVKLLKVRIKVINHQSVETVDELHIPRFIKGRVCNDCFASMWAEAFNKPSRKDGKRAVEVIFEDSDYV